MPNLLNCERSTNSVTGCVSFTDLFAIPTSLSSPPVTLVVIAEDLEGVFSRFSRSSARGWGVTVGTVGPMCY